MKYIHIVHISLSYSGVHHTSVHIQFYRSVYFWAPLYYIYEDIHTYIYASSLNEKYDQGLIK